MTGGNTLHLKRQYLPLVKPLPLSTLRLIKRYELEYINNCPRKIINILLTQFICRDVGIETKVVI